MNICLIVHLHCFSAFLMLSLFPDNKLYFLHKNSVYARVLGSLFAPFNFWKFSRRAFCCSSNGFISESCNIMQHCVWVFIRYLLFINICLEIFFLNFFFNMFYIFACGIWVRYTVPAIFSDVQVGTALTFGKSLSYLLKTQNFKVEYVLII